MTAIRMRRGGLLTTVQDLGRWGHQARGVPPAGPMDAWSHRLANRLVGNDDSAALLEVTLIGPEIEFIGDEAADKAGRDADRAGLWIAVTGADFALTLGDRPAAMNVALRAPAGCRLRFGERRRGARAYVAVRGGIATPAVLGSRATHVASRMGGCDGRRLRDGDVLPLEAAVAGAPVVPRRLTPVALPASGARVRVTPGPHDRRFGPLALRELEGTRFVISPHSDRMGYRLDGAAPRATAGEMISDAMPRGGLQIPASGQPILLMADAATAGGYPVLATVITSDLPLAGQLAPGDWIEFAVCTQAEALAALIAQERMLT